MITGVDGGVTGLRLILTSDGESGVEIGKTPRGEGRTAGHKLNEGLPLVRIQLTQDRDKPLKSRALFGVSLFGLCVVKDVLPAPIWILVPTY